MEDGEREEERKREEKKVKEDRKIKTNEERKREGTGGCKAGKEGEKEEE